jgi:diguanylate cyclase (GGDEF)-like protein
MMFTGWQEGAVLVTAAAALAGGGAMVYALRLRHARLREEQLLRLVSERTLQLEEANRRLEELSFVDSLTGVANRRQFEQLLDLEWRRAVRSGHSLSLLIADIDRFKAFNDTYGHQAGDCRLREVANLLDGVVQRAGDQVARYGGEEFAALLPETDAAGATAIADRMRRAVDALCTDGRRVTISFGVASTRPIDQSTPHALVAAADAALYEAKRDGRNLVRTRTI